MQAVANVTKLLNFLTGGEMTAILQAGGGPGRGSPGARRQAQLLVLQELLPFLPSVATEMVPQLTERLVSRILARTLRELYIY